MNKHYLSLALISAMALASCSKENDDVDVQQTTNNNIPEVEDIVTDDSQKVYMTFKAGYNESNGLSKTAVISGLQLGFSAGDEIAVYDGWSVNRFLSDIKSGNAPTCNFSGSARTASKYYAAYPYSNYVSNTYFYTEMPSTQSPVAGTFDSKAHLMMAYSETDVFTFKTVNAFLKFKAPRNLKAVVLNSNNGEAVSGKVDIYNFDELNLSHQTKNDWVLLDGDMKKDDVYYISYLPSNFTKGLTLLFVDEDGLVAEYSTKAFTSKSNQINNIAEANLSSLVFKSTVSSASLSAYLNSFGEYANVDVVLSDYDNPEKVKANITKDMSKKINIVLPDGIESIPEGAFDYCNNLVGITIPSSVKSIGKKAFSSTHITSIAIPDNVTSIGDYAFQSTSITEVTLPDGVESIGANSFAYCNDLKSVTIPNSVKSIGEEAFSSTAIEELSLPEGITSIAKNTFSYSKNLKNVVIPNTVTNIGEGAFRGTAVENIVLPNGLPSIADNLFNGCANLTAISIPNTVKTIGERAFQNTAIEEITLPSNIKSIQQYTFMNCENLKTITIPDGVVSIGGNAFNGCSSLEEIIIPNSVKTIGEYAFSGTNIKTLPNGIINIEEGLFEYCYNLTKAVIPYGAKSIGEFAFDSCDELASVTISSTVENIDSWAFSYCPKLTSIEIPSNVNYIGEGAFEGCEQLKTVTILGTPDLDSDIFWYCPDDLVIYVNETTYNNYSQRYPQMQVK